MNSGHRKQIEYITVAFDRGSYPFYFDVSLFLTVICFSKEIEIPNVVLNFHFMCIRYLACSVLGNLFDASTYLKHI